MSMVMFAMLCDVPDCRKRSPEYTPWWTCRECLGDFCDDHIQPGTATNDENGMRAVCKSCAIESQS